MDYTKILIIIFAAGLIMYLMRMLPLVFCKGTIKNKFLQSFLSYVPFAVLTSMTIPEVFTSTSNIISATVGLLISIVLAYFGQGLLMIIFSSTVAVFLIEQIMRFINF